MDAEIISDNENMLLLKDKDGKKIECQKLFTFDSEETKLSYICYTDLTKDDKGNVVVYAGTYDPTGEDNKIKPIKTDKEWEVIQKTLEEIVKGIGENSDGRE